MTAIYDIKYSSNGPYCIEFDKIIDANETSIADKMKLLSVDVKVACYFVITKASYYFAMDSDYNNLSSIAFNNNKKYYRTVDMDVSTLEGILKTFKTDAAEFIR